MSFLRRVAVSIPMAIFLAIALAGQSFGAGWSARILIDEAAGTWPDLVTFANGTAIASIEDCVGGAFCTGIVALRRSTDGGLTWGPRMSVAPIEEYDEADMAAIAGRGKHVDIVWRGDGLLYRHSGDQGQRFGRARYITHEGSVQEPEVSRGPNGLVAVSWGEWPQFDDQISVRVSDDGGRTFGAKHSWPANDAYYSSLAVGDGVVYVAYINAVGTGVVRRSLDAGDTWSAAVSVGWGPVVTAEGSEAYVAASGMYRRTTNNGASWSLSAPLAPPGSNPHDSFVSLQDGVVRALYSTDDATFYRQSSDGTSWTAPKQVTGKTHPGMVGRAGGRLVLLYQDIGYVRVFVKTRPV